METNLTVRHHEPWNKGKHPRSTDEPRIYALFNCFSGMPRWKAPYAILVLRLTMLWR